MFFNFFKRPVQSPARLERSGPLCVRHQFGSSGQAVFFNNTAASYHWGCYGTSMAIYEALIDTGYSVVCFDVETTHQSLGEAPYLAGPEQIDQFGQQLQAVNPMAFRAIIDSDLIVINGEGTIHRFHQGPRVLLSIAKYASGLGKRVHLINHSCFPSGSAEPAADHIEEFYKTCLNGVERIVVRDIESSRNLDRLGINHTVGFDCLPYYVRRHPDIPEMPKAIVVGAASWWQRDRAKQFAVNLIESGVLNSGTPVIFLSGGFKRAPEEDEVHFECMKEIIPALQLTRPPSLGEWMGWIKSSQIVITGRFHHFIAAATVRAPIIYGSGNTPKTEAVAEMVGAPLGVELAEQNGGLALRTAMQKPFRTSSTQVEFLQNKASENLNFD